MSMAGARALRGRCGEFGRIRTVGLAQFLRPGASGRSFRRSRVRPAKGRPKRGAAPRPDPAGPSVTRAAPCPGRAGGCAVPADSELAGRATLTLADLAARRVALNTVAGTTTLDLWPAGARPPATIEVDNTDEWLTAIAGARAVGVSTAATPGCTATR
ncbi:hypothetical protein [Kitasatospora purpeofusca]|uniref:hypothetical protein n=1 Tax=Kitasatospora purpeofusca TaxID=67352 RepID=UPI00386A53FF